MKTAAIWMGDKFEIETSKLGNEKKYIVVFDVQKVAKEGLRSLELTESNCDENLHFHQDYSKQINQETTWQYCSILLMPPRLDIPS